MEMTGQLIRFGVIGVIATALHVTTAIAMGSLFALAPLQANFAGFLIATLFAYFGHARVTFGRPVWQVSQFRRFLFSGLATLSLSSVMVWTMTSMLQVDFALAMVVVGMTVPVFSYLVMHLWVFDKRGESSSSDVIGIAVCAAIAALVLALVYGRQINHDTAWYLLSVREWLGGAALFTDIVEVNPPLNFYYTLPAIWLADLLSISDKNGQYLAHSLLLFVSLLWCRSIIRNRFDLTPQRGLLFLLLLAGAMTLSALGDYGQREHTMVLLMTPWLLLQTAERPATREQEINAALVAGLGVCLKPHFVLIPLAITLLQMGRQRSWRPVFSTSNLTLLAVGLAYVAFVAVVHPTYLTVIVPTAQDIYGDYKAPLPFLISRAGSLIVILAILLACAIMVARRERGASREAATDRKSGPDATIFIAAAIAALAVYLLQGTGFHYHLIPLKSFAITAAAIFLVTARRVDLVFIIALIACLKPWNDSIRDGFYSNSRGSEIIGVAQGLGHIDSLMVFTSHVSLGPGPALELGAQWVSHYSSNWLVPGAVNQLAKTDCTADPALCARLDGYLAKNRAANIADMRRVPPDLIVFDRNSGYFDKPGFSWPDFMAQDPAWTEVIAGYEQVQVTDHAIYMRRTAGSL